jgi:hypothetical protein
MTDILDDCARSIKPDRKVKLVINSWIVFYLILKQLYIFALYLTIEFI